MEPCVKCILDAYYTYMYMYMQELVNTPAAITPQGSTLQFSILIALI